jgi:hypothetical protein
MKFWFALIIVGFLSNAVQAKGNTHSHMVGMKHGAQMSVGMLPKEGGQSAFAAIQEIVGMLEADPETDWSKVDIEALRQHLMDMNNVTLNAVVSTSQTERSITFTVSGEDDAVGSIQRMITGHVATMDGANGWKLSAETDEKGAVLKVTPPDQSSMAKLRALGFIGVMAQGMHHQQHHWMLANGKAPHQ